MRMTSRVKRVVADICNRMSPRYNVNVSERHSFEGCEGACLERVPISAIQKKFNLSPDMLARIRSLSPGEEILCASDALHEYYISRAR